MLVHSRTEITKVKGLLDGTQVDLWLGKLNGSLNVQITSHIPGKSPASVNFDALRLIQNVITSFGFGEEIMPYLAIRPNKSNEYMMPFETNVQAIVTHAMWPITIADRMAEAAQNMVGHFTGKKVTVEPMGEIKVTDRGEVDMTLKVGDAWTEKFELADNCVFCLKMTDESVKDRVAGFQWALDKEVSARFGAGEATYSNPPLHYNHDDTDAGRREYHNQLKPWFVGHPMLLKVIPLIDLPLHLKRTLCIQWNHIVLEHLEAEPRFVRREEDGMYFWMNVAANFNAKLKSLIPSIRTRSNPSGDGTDPASPVYNSMFIGGSGDFS